MKTTKLIMCLLSALAMIATAFGGTEVKNPKPTKPEPAKNDNSAGKSEESVVLTGSYIKRTVKRNGQITDGPYQVVVIDQKTIANSGASSLKQLLNRHGVGR